MHTERMIDRLRLPDISARGRAIVAAVLAAIAVAALGAGSISYLTMAPSDPIDFGVFGPPGSRLLTGDWHAIFADPIIQAGPLELVFWGVPQLIGITAPMGWAVFYVVAGSLILAVLVVVVERPLRSIASEWSVQLATAIAALAALSGSVVIVLNDGHPAQLAIAILWLAAGISARRGFPLVAGILLGLTAGWEVWGLLGAPVLLLAPRLDARTVWRTGLGVLGVIAALFAPFVVLGPFRMFEYSWGVSGRSLPALLFPGTAGFPWPLRIAQGVMSVGAGVGAALSLRRSLDAIWLVPLAVCAVRLLFDPLLAGYYAVAPVILVLVGLVFSAAQRSFAAAIGCLLVFNALLDFPLSVPVTLLVLVLVALTAALVIRSDRGRVAREIGP